MSGVLYPRVEKQDYVIRLEPIRTNQNAVFQYVSKGNGSVESIEMNVTPEPATVEMLVEPSTEPPDAVLASSEVETVAIPPPPLSVAVAEVIVTPEESTPPSKLEPERGGNSDSGHQLICCLCKKEFHSRRSVRRHIRKVHKKKMEELRKFIEIKKKPNQASRRGRNKNVLVTLGRSCPVCFKSFATKANVRRHFDEVHRGLRRDSITPDIATRPGQPLSLDSNSAKKTLKLRKQKPSSKAEYNLTTCKCLLCKRKYSSQVMLKRHMLIVHKITLSTKITKKEKKPNNAIKTKTKVKIEPAESTQSVPSIVSPPKSEMKGTNNAKEKKNVAAAEKKNVAAAEKKNVAAAEKNVAAAEKKNVAAAEKNAVSAERKNAAGKNVVSTKRKNVVSTKRKNAVSAERKNAVSAKRKNAEGKNAVSAERKNAERKNAVSAERKNAVSAERKNAERKNAVSDERKNLVSTERKTAVSAERKSMSSAKKKLPPSTERKGVSSAEKKSAPSKEKKRVSSVEKKSVPPTERKGVSSAEKKSTPSKERKHLLPKERKKNPSTMKNKAKQASEKNSKTSSKSKAVGPPKPRKTRLSAGFDFRKIFCKLCKRQFTSKQNLTKHIELHTDGNNIYVKFYRCPICAYETRRKRDVIRHIAVVHKKTSQYISKITSSLEMRAVKKPIDFVLKKGRKRGPQRDEEKQNGSKQDVTANSPSKKHEGTDVGIEVKVTKNFSLHRCNKCGKAFARKAFLEHHKETHKANASRSPEENHKAKGRSTRSKALVG